MPRRAKTEQKPPEWVDPPKGETIELELKLITPMFGGGFNPGVVDDAVPIRAAAIRGHLRFWWRATSGAKYATVQELYAAEAELWGEAAREKPSGSGGMTGEGKVKLSVQTTNEGKNVGLNSIRPKSTSRDGPLNGVFLFPFERQNDKGAQGRKDVQFTVTLSGPVSSELRTEVETALVAWVLFGGIGARTRRGCGAMQALQPAHSIPRDPESLKEWLAKLPKANHNLWPTHGGGWLVLGEKVKRNEKSDDRAKKAWESLGRYWSAFRKGHIWAKYSPMSGGKWCDHATLQGLKEGAETVELVKPFLGLPIVYQRFKGKDGRPDAFAGTIEPVGSGRMASPLILKPLVFPDGSVHPIVVCLRAEAPTSVKIGDQFEKLKLRLASDDLLRKFNEQDDSLLKDCEQPFKAALLVAKQELNGELIGIGGSA